MINMVEKNAILLKYYQDNKSYRQISRETGLHRETVKKYIEEQKKASKDKEEGFLSKGLLQEPIYKVGIRLSSVLTEEIKQLIDIHISENTTKRQNRQGKQVKKKIDIYENLQELGHKISYSTVCNYVRFKENQSKESFIKQLYSPGDICEFDWGEVKIYHQGHLQKFNMAVFTMAYSNHRFAKLFTRQDTLSFSQSMIDYFTFIKGVPSTMVFDNMRVAVAKFVGRNKKEPTKALLELSSYYTFKYRFCNVRKGNEKGHVEKSVDYIRRKAFSHKDKFDSLYEANQYLQQKCESLNSKPQQLKPQQTADDLFKEESSKLYTFATPYVCFDNEVSKADKYSTITYKKNRYSVPDYLVGKMLNLKIFAQKIDVYFNKEYVCSHNRSYKLQSWTMNIEHYLNTLTRKPGAIQDSVAFNQLQQEVKDIYTEFFTSEPKSFIELLQYCKDNLIALSEIDKVVNKLRKVSLKSINKDSILVSISKSEESSQTTIKQESLQSEDARCIEKYSQDSLRELSLIMG
jgi:transposase